MENLGKDIAKIRTDYAGAELDKRDVAADPMKQFHLWMEAAVKAEVNEPTAMHLASCDDDGAPTLRVVLLKEFSPAGFSFFTNYESQKGRQLIAHPTACLNFFWPELARQVRIEGSVIKVSREESDAYFSTRPRESQIGAWASPQSQMIAGRTVLDEAVQAIEKRFAGMKIPRPEHWGGFILRPSVIEFWQGRPSRLHDRIRYCLKGDQWIIERIAP